MKEFLNYIGDGDWEKDIFSDWASNEENQPGWQETAKMKGWDNWREWRSFSAGKLNLQNREWRIYSIENPLKVVPGILVGPFPSWQKYVPDNLINQISFGDYLELNLERLRNNLKINELIDNFPASTQIIGLIEPINQQIVCVEGTHRCTAISLASKLNREIAGLKEVRIALAKLEESEKDLLSEALKIGTKKPE
ncbi:MAG: hypothetical protein ACRCZE_04645 [Candidatus Altimarinota bacterium]